MIKSWVKLNGLISSCHKCPGMNVPGKTSNCPGYGTRRNTVMLVGQSLCTDCMVTKIPFTGGSGLILDKAFKSAGLKKKDLFITNVVHCHPPKNRASTIEEVNNCRGFLINETLLVKPKLVICLGGDAKRAFLCFNHDNFEVFELAFHGIKLNVVGVTHPAYFLYTHNAKAEELYVAKLGNLIRRYYNDND